MQKTKTKNDLSTPLPTGQIWSVCLIQITEGMNTNVLFPFLAFMTEDFGYTGHRLGIFAGLLAATFSGAQFCSSMVWGMISDRYGRKFALLTGVFGAAIGMAIFGSARSYTQAILGRALCGLLSGNLGIIKSFLTEFTDTSNRSKAFSMWSLASTCGNIVGPLLGGYLCRPAQQFPAFFSEDSLFGVYPYLLPCLVVVALDVLVSIFCFFAMAETRFSEEDSLPPPHPVPSSPLSWIARNFSYNQVEQEGYRSVAVDARDEEGGIAMRVLEIERVVERARNGSIEHMDFEQHRTVTSLLELAGDDDKIPSNDEDDVTEAKPPAAPKRSVLWDPKVLFSTGSYGVLAMAFILLDETIPLLLKQDIADGGMSFSSAQIGTLLALSGVALLIFSTVFLSAMCKGSKLLLYRNYTLASLPLVLGFPVIAILNQKYFSNLGPALSSNLLWASLLLVYTCRNILATLSFSGIIMLINNSAPEKDLGLVNGFGQSLASAARCIGPAIGGALWSLSVRSRFIFLNFLFVQLLLVWAVVMGSYLPPSIDYGDALDSSSDKDLDPARLRLSVDSGLLEEDLSDEENCGTP